MKKVICLLLALLMLISCVSIAENEEPVTLKIWTQEILTEDPYESPVFAMIEEKLGIKIEWQLIGSSEDMATAFNLSIISDELPDIYSYTFTTAQIEMCIEGGKLLPLNDYIESDCNYKKMLEEQPGYRKMLTASDGNIYTFVYTDCGVHKDSEYKMYIRESWLEALGMDMPETTDEFKDLLIAIRDTDLNGNGDPNDEIPMVGYYNGRKTDPICFLMNPFELYNENYYVITDEGQIRFLANTDGWREGLAYIADLYAEGLIDEQTYSQDEAQFQALLNRKEEDAIVALYPNWFAAAEMDTNCVQWTDFVVVPPLMGESGLRQSAARRGGDFRLHCAISSTCKNPDKAFELLDYFLSDEGNMCTQWGIEGVNYEWIDGKNYAGGDKSVSIIGSRYATNRMPRYDSTTVRYASMDDEGTYNSDTTYVLVSAADAYEPYYVWHNIPNIIWCSDTEVADKKANYQVLFNEYIQTMNTQFVMGKLDINDDAAWNEYLAKLNEMGLDDYISCLEVYFGL